MYKYEIGYTIGDTRNCGTFKTYAKCEDEAIYKMYEQIGEIVGDVVQVEKKYVLELTREQMQVIHDLAYIGISNGNHIEPKAYEPTPDQYKTLCSIANMI